MIFDQLMYADRYFGIHPRLDEALRFLQEGDLSHFTPGKNQIQGDDIYVNRASYSTAEPDARIWEAHERYVDIHVVLAGEELFHVSAISNMSCTTPYDAEKEAAFYAGEPEAVVRLLPGYFLVCFPQDVHKSGVRRAVESEVQKIICKVLL